MSDFVPGPPQVLAGVRYISDQLEYRYLLLVTSNLSWVGHSGHSGCLIPENQKHGVSGQ
jgi:hypothetical protein